MEEEIKKYVAKNLNYSLAVENYVDNTGNTNESIDNAYELLKKYRTIKDSLSKEEELEMVRKISDIFDFVVDEIGRDNFIFYDDGDINYIWKDGKENE